MILCEYDSHIFLLWDIYTCTLCHNLLVCIQGAVGLNSQLFLVHYQFYLCIECKVSSNTILCNILRYYGFFFHWSFLSCAIKRMSKSNIRRELFEMLFLRGLVFCVLHFFSYKIPGFLTKNIINQKHY